MNSHQWIGMVSVRALAIGLAAWLLTEGRASASDATPRYEITAPQVTSALAQQKFPTDGLTIKFATPVTSSAPAPQLVIQSASMTSPHETRLRMGCVISNECLPFYAYASWPENGPTVDLPAVFEAKKLEAKKLEAKKLEAKKRSAPAPSRTEASLRAGTAATLMLEAGRVHIKLQVVCLEGGSVGDTIRVTGKDHKQSYSAEVVGSNLLKGSL